MSAPSAVLAATASAITLVAVVGIEAHAGLLFGAGAVAALIFGFIAGGVRAQTPSPAVAGDWPPASTTDRRLSPARHLDTGGCTCRRTGTCMRPSAAVRRPEPPAARRPRTSRPRCARKTSDLLLRPVRRLRQDQAIERTPERASSVRAVALVAPEISDLEPALMGQRLGVVSPQGGSSAFPSRRFPGASPPISTPEASASEGL